MQPTAKSGAERLRRLGLCLVFLLVMAGCGDNNSGSSPGSTPTQQAALSTATTVGQASTPTTAALATPTRAEQATPTEMAVATNTAPPVVGPDEFQNPVLRNDFADPDVIQAGDTYYAYATNASGRNIEAARSKDLVKWEILTDAMPALPSWAQLGGSLVWAPALVQAGGKFLMYYTARDTASDKQCVGVATADKPDGKFLDKNDHPFVCVPDEGGDIDASPFSDGDKLYLYWKNDGNCCGITTYIYGQELSPDGLTLVGEPKRLIQNDQYWEGRVIEGPEMFKHDNAYYLFFSGGNYADATYAVGYATCDGPLGPCQQADENENPILHSKMETEPLVIGPGGQSLIQVGDQTWMLYHVWDEESGMRGDSRYMWLDRVDWTNGKPVVKGPTTGPQPKPKP